MVEQLFTAIREEKDNRREKKEQLFTAKRETEPQPLVEELTEALHADPHTKYGCRSSIVLSILGLHSRNGGKFTALFVSARRERHKHKGKWGKGCAKQELNSAQRKRGYEIMVVGRPFPLVWPGCEPVPRSEFPALQP